MDSLRILLIGNGGREHALAWRLSQSPRVESIVVVPGNGGTASLPKVSNDTTVSQDDFDGLVALARAKNVNLAVPGPEAPLVAGVEGYFRRAGIACFGPSVEAARMEGSKTFSKDFMKRHGIPTAAYENFSDYEAASAYLKTVNHRVVLKATGLAAGKGVIIPENQEEAQAGLREIMQTKAFGSAGDEVVIEEFLEGDELSILSFCDGYTFRSLPAAQDHKRIFDGDQGPNTGGMGCYAPTALATPELLERIDREILKPTFDGFRQERCPFRGLLFTGLMITPLGEPKVLEYNVRFGDPETQTVLPLLSADTDLAEIMVACTEGWLDQVNIAIDNKFSVTVVAAAAGYPGSYAKGTSMAVTQPPVGSGINVFHAGTALDGQQLRTAGGRVIAANATADSIQAAVERAYKEGVSLINFDGMFFRKDIAHRAFRTTAAKPVEQKQESLSYAQAGVSIDAGNALVERIKRAVATTARPGADAEIGGFGGEVDLAAAGFPGAPILVGAIDGVGTKLKIAQEAKRHDTVGIDLVAMNVNDLVVQGAEPVMFLDYYGCSALDIGVAASFVEGVAEGCRLAGCALVGGETAEMPGMYQPGDYDVAGAAVGVMQPASRLPRKQDMVAGDIVLGLASNGVHSNGFSLVRRIVERSGLAYSDPAPWGQNEPTAKPSTVAETLLAPTRIYVKSLLAVLAGDGGPSGGSVKGLAHITGGGLTENVPRMLPSHLAAEIDVASFIVPPVFAWLRRAGNVAPAEMARTFNNGIGMAIVVGAADSEAAASALQAQGETVFRIGQLVDRPAGGEGCVLRNLDSWAA